MFQPGNQLGRRFEPGNVLSLHHGASGRALETATAQALDELEAVLGDGPGSEPRYAAARAGFARAAARVRLLTDWLDRVGLFDGKGRPRPVLDKLAAAETSLLRWSEALGLTPASAARLGLNLSRTVDLAAALAQARRGAR